MPSKTCKQVVGMKCVMYRGKPVYYKNLDMLSKTLKISRVMASKLIKDNGRRIIKKETGEVEVINIKKENPLGLLSREFNIKRLANKNLINGHYFPTKNVEILKELGPNEEDKGLNIHIKIYLNFSSPYMLDTFKILNEEGKKQLHQKIIQNGFKYNKNRNIYIKNNKVLSISDYYKFLNSQIRYNKKENKFLKYEQDGGIILRKKHYIFSGEQKDIENFVKDKVSLYSGNNKIKILSRVIFYDFWIGSSYQDKKLFFEDGYIRDFENEYELTQWVNIQYNYKNKKGDSCAISFIGKKYPELYWEIKDLEDENGVTLKNFMNFCKGNSIGYNIYNELGEKLYLYKGDLGNINCIIYNNHIYPLYGGKPKKYCCKEYNIILLENSNKEYKKYISNKKLPSNIKIGDIISKTRKKSTDDIDIISFTVKDDKYIFNPEYNKCSIILKKIGYEKYIYDNININDICKLLEKIYKVQSTSSFLPEKHYFKTPPLYYKTNFKIDKNKEIVTIDKNKSYPYALYNLPYLIIFDWRKDKVNKNPKNIKESFLYISKPKKWSIAMPCTKIYAGYHLIECKNLGLEFELLEELETCTVPNYYRKIIKLMFENMDEKDFKSAMVILIGKFERDMSEVYNYKYIGTYNEESSKMYEGFTQKIGDNKIFFKETKKFKYARDKIPISTQVKDMSRMMLINKIKELKIKDNDIIQINTDSITYYGILPKNLNRNTFEGWKESEYKDIGFVDTFNLYEYNNQNIPTLLNLKNNNTGYTELYMKYAGSGKTTHIVNKIIPEIKEIEEILSNMLKEENRDNSYIVLTPTHSTLSELKKKGINCKIVQKYTFSETIPTEKNIIFDEIGFADLSCHDLLYKLNHLNKNLICFGDFNQLLPIEEDRPCNQPHYLNFLFKKIDTKFVNYRNNFTKEYYDKIINEEIDIVKEVNKYSTSLYNADVVLCYRTNKSKVFKTRDVYNNKILKKLGKKSNDIGVKLICINNKLIEKNIYNHKQLVIKEKYKEDDDKNIFYKLEDEIGEEFIITEKQLKYFRPAYALNVYEAQGMTLKSYHWATEDDKFLYGNMAYTIISRLYQDKE
jgi:hypothetical protein